MVAIGFPWLFVGFYLPVFVHCSNCRDPLRGPPIGHMSIIHPAFSAFCSFFFLAFRFALNAHYGIHRQLRTCAVSLDVNTCWDFTACLLMDNEWLCLRNSRQTMKDSEMEGNIRESAKIHSDQKLPQSYHSKSNNILITVLNKCEMDGYKETTIQSNTSFNAVLSSLRSFRQLYSEYMHAHSFVWRL